MKTILIFLIFFIYNNITAAQSLFEGRADTNIESIFPIDLRPGTAESLVMIAERLAEGESVTLDGYLDEDDWLKAHVATEFIHGSPNDGHPDSERTGVSFLYTENTTPVFSQPQSNTVITPSEQREILTHAISVLNENYVFPEVAERMVASLRERINRGEYAEAARAQAFAES